MYLNVYLYLCILLSIIIIVDLQIRARIHVLHIHMSTRKKNVIFANRVFIFRFAFHDDEHGLGTSDYVIRTTVKYDNFIFDFGLFHESFTL